MNQINFLPDKYRQRQVRRQRRIRRFTLLGVAALVAAFGGALLQQQTSALAAQAAAVHQQVESLHNQQLEVNRLARQRRHMTDEVDLQRRLGMALRDSQIITALAGHLPDNVGLDDISIQLDAGASRHGGSGRGSHGGARRLSIKIQGIAPDDMTVANVVSALARDPLFSKVTMRFSRPATQDRVEGREFGLTMSVNLKRRFLVTGSEQEVARAD